MFTWGCYGYRRFGRPVGRFLDHLQMMKRLIFLFLLLVHVFAFADAPVTQYSYSIYPSGTGWAASVSASADGQMTYYNSNSANTGNGQYSFSVDSVGSTSYVYRRTCVKYQVVAGGSTCTVGSYTTSTNTPSTRQWCATGVAPDTSQPLVNQCPAQCPAGVNSTVMMDYGVVPPGDAWQSTAALPNVWNGCQVKTTSVIECNDYISDGHLRCRYVVQNTGQVAGIGGVSATADMGPGGTSSHPDQMPPSKAPDSSGCPGGSVKAGVDSTGIPICVGTGTAPNTSSSSSTTTGPSTSVTNADGSTTQTQAVNTTNADGSVTTTMKTTTTATDGSVTVSVSSSTGATPSGAPGKPGVNGVNGKDALSLCEANPNLTICTNSSATTDCTAGVSYTGDAIQGATLQAVNAMKCKQQQDDSDLKASAVYAKGSSVLGGVDPDASSLPSIANASTTAIPSSLDTTGFAGVGGSPFSDVSFTVQGKTFTIPFNHWSSYLLTFRYVMMIVASLVSFRMLSGAIFTE